MTEPKTDIDRIAAELKALADTYAAKAAQLASDPYFKEAVVKASVSGFVWALYDACNDPFSRDALGLELKVQSAAIDRALSGEKVAN